MAIDSFFGMGFARKKKPESDADETEETEAPDPSVTRLRPSSGSLIYGLPAPDEPWAEGKSRAGARDKLTGDIDNSLQAYGALQDALDNYDDYFGTFQGQLDVLWSRIKEKGGVASDEDSDLLERYTQFRASLMTAINRTLKALSGGQVTPQEAERLVKEMPSDNDAPTEFYTKIRVKMGYIASAIMRATFCYYWGFDINQMSRFVGFEDVGDYIEKRVDEISTFIESQHRLDVSQAQINQAALAQAEEEFGPLFNEYRSSRQRRRRRR